MVGHAEKQRLLKEFRNHPAYGLGVVLKCAAALLILAGLAVIGITDPSPQAPTVASTGSAAPQEQAPVAAADRATGSEENRE